jgi:molybdopterin-guanine dinucleotide biosynthesis protein A
MVEFPTVVLAGGEGRRMGGGKPLRRLSGSTLIARALGLAGSWSPEVAVAVRVPAQVGRIDAPVIRDRANVAGPLGGLVAALEWAAAGGHDRVLTIPCDMPGLPGDLAERLNAALGPDVRAVVAAGGGRLHPTCALWRTELIGRALDEARAGRRSRHGRANLIDCVVIDWAGAGPAFLNTNTPEDLAVATTLLR